MPTQGASETQPCFSCDHSDTLLNNSTAVTHKLFHSGFLQTTLISNALSSTVRLPRLMFSIKASEWCAMLPFVCSFPGQLSNMQADSTHQSLTLIGSGAISWCGHEGGGEGSVKTAYTGLTVSHDGGPPHQAEDRIMLEGRCDGKAAVMGGGQV